METESITMNNKVYFYRGTDVSFMLKAWRVLNAYIPNAGEQDKYFYKDIRPKDNYDLLVNIGMKATEKISSMELMKIACAYDCLFYYETLCKDRNRVSSLRGILFDIVLP